MVVVSLPSALKVVTEIGKEIAKETYADAGKTSAIEFGKASGMAVAFVSAAVESLARKAGGDPRALVDMFQGRLTAKVNAISPENRIVPSPRIGVPALAYYPAVSDDDQADLRDMFERVLASSMDRTRASNVHPSFVEVLKQMTSIEARFCQRIAAIAQKPGSSFGLLFLDVAYKEGGFKRLGFVSALDLVLTDTDANLEASFDNLFRLGILGREGIVKLQNDEKYEPLRATRGFKRLIASAEATLEADPSTARHEEHMAAFHFTRYGREFLRVCASDLSSAAPQNPSTPAG